MDFDNYKDRYYEDVQKAIPILKQNLDYYIERKTSIIADLAEKYCNAPRNTISVLDVGCGIGLADKYLTRSSFKVYGVDIAAGVIEKALENNPSVNYRLYDGNTLPYQENYFRISFASCVFHHVDQTKWVNLMKEMKRVTKEDGLVVVFEHNPYNPVTRYIVKKCQFDRDAVLLNRGQVKSLMHSVDLYPVESKYILFTPIRGDLYIKLEYNLGWIPIGTQYYVVGKKCSSKSFIR